MLLNFFIFFKLFKWKLFYKNGLPSKKIKWKYFFPARSPEIFQIFKSQKVYVVEMQKCYD